MAINIICVIKLINGICVNCVATLKNCLRVGCEYVRRERGRTLHDDEKLIENLLFMGLFPFRSSVMCGMIIVYVLSFKKLQTHFISLSLVFL